MPTSNSVGTISAIVSATLSAAETITPQATDIIQPSTTPTAAEYIPLNEAGLTRTDEQGAVVVDVSPINLSAPGETIDFEVGRNTHSVDLSMDLATLATLKTDTGLTAVPVSWDGVSGGHHISGKLVFPASTDGKPILEGANVLTLVILNVDAPERSFTWDLTP